MYFFSKENMHDLQAMHLINSVVHGGVIYHTVARILSLHSYVTWIPA